jgi:hypothetical protein
MFADVNFSTRNDAIEQFDDVGIAHADAATRPGLAVDQMVWATVEVDEPAESIYLS